MEYTKNQSNLEVVKEVLFLALTTPPLRLVPELRKFARQRLDSGYANAQLYADLQYVYDIVSELEEEEREDAILDVMDFLTGWCAPKARLY